MTEAHTPRPLILLAEDEVLIALELADSLERDGFEVAGPFTTCTAAEAWLKGHEPSGAILDNALKDGPCEALAGDLQGRGIPFLVYSGHSRTPDLPEVFANVPWIVKPAPTEALLRALHVSLRGE
ncbi:histidine kinase [Salinarimonas soli]|uniref:Histidine kinase n=1 Tax=Salinarimonas soli TaxID=1638099 RepID=A0A5B2VCL4_9HYPH|nr:histidine kinase [Salinarimonas soli]KAA2236485.1 histidine kinase [Salinarimonas soli]